MREWWRHVIVSTLLPALVHATTLYVSPTGSDTNSGAIDSPFSNIVTAVNLVGPGDTIYMRGGTYCYSTTILIGKAGTASAPISLFAYPNERPFLDFSAQAYSSANRGIHLTNSAAYWHIKGLEVYRAGDNGMKIEGNNNTIEFCSFHHCRDTGLQIGLGKDDTNDGTMAASNIIRNCDGYLNYDYLTGGQNADGLDCKLSPGPGNMFIGCRSWENSDDGMDLYQCSYPVILSNCWTWHNGDPASFGTNSVGNAEGFKLGGNSSYGANHVVIGCIAFDNVYGGSSAGRGYHQNDNNKGITLLNCLSYSNNYNYSLNNDISESHVIENCVGFGGITKNVSSNSNSIYIDNSWNFSTNVLTANAADYVILTEAAAKAPRQADGSLPNNGFARLVAGSDLIDKGVNVGLPFNGPAPDLGPFEFSAPRVVLIDAVSMTDTGLRLHVSGLTSDGPIIVLTSADLMAWTPIFTNPPITGGWTYIDPNAANATQQFYQVEEQ